MTVKLNNCKKYSDPEVINNGIFIATLIIPHIRAQRDVIVSIMVLSWLLCCPWRSLLQHCGVHSSCCLAHGILEYQSCFLFWALSSLKGAVLPWPLSSLLPGNPHLHLLVVDVQSTRAIPVPKGPMGSAAASVKFCCSLTSSFTNCTFPSLTWIALHLHP